MALFDQLAKLKQRSKKSSKSQQSSNLQNSSPGGTTGNCGFCVSTPNVSTISQANTLRRPNVNKSQDWLNVDKEKSVRFTLPPDEVKRRERFYFLSLFIIEEWILEAKTDFYGKDWLFVASFEFCVITFEPIMIFEFCERYLCRWRKIG